MPHPGGLFAVCTASRRNDPELAPSRWDRSLSFDVQRRGQPRRTAPNRALYLRGRGLSERDAAAAAGRRQPCQDRHSAA